MCSAGSTYCLFGRGHFDWWREIPSLRGTKTIWVCWLHWVLWRRMPACCRKTGLIVFDKTRHAIDLVALPAGWWWVTGLRHSVACCACIKLKKRPDFSWIATTPFKNKILRRIKEPRILVWIVRERNEVTSSMWQDYYGKSGEDMLKHANNLMKWISPQESTIWAVHRVRMQVGTK